MKRIIALITALIIAVSALSVGVCAADKSDLLAEAAKSPVYKYVKVALENAARTVEITDEQAEKLLPIIKRFNTIVTEDLGPTAARNNNGEDIYTMDQIRAVMECVSEACEILNYTYKTKPSSDPKHIGDSVFMIYDQNNKLVFQYDGDVVADTSAASDADTIALAVGAIVMLALGAAAVVAAKKRDCVR